MLLLFSTLSSPFQLIFRKVSDVKKERELAERRKNDPALNHTQDHLVRKLFSKFRKGGGAGSGGETPLGGSKDLERGESLLADNNGILPGQQPQPTSPNPSGAAAGAATAAANQNQSSSNGTGAAKSFANRIGASSEDRGDNKAKGGGGVSKAPAAAAAGGGGGGAGAAKTGGGGGRGWGRFKAAAGGGSKDSETSNKSLSTRYIYDSLEVIMAEMHEMYVW